MNAQTTNGAHQDGAGAVGMGGATSGQAGATPSHETQRETGGSGGEQLTASQGEVAADGKRERDGQPGRAEQPGHAAAQSPAGAPAVTPDPAEPRETSMHSGARGALDTRSDQAGGTGTGLGAPESGANQSPADLAPPADGKA